MRKKTANTTTKKMNQANGNGSGGGGSSAISGPRPRIEVMRVPSIERASFRPLDGVQLRATYSHVRVGTYCGSPEPQQLALPPPAPYSPAPDCSGTTCTGNSRKHKMNLGPVSRLLRRRHHATRLATKSCDNIYSVNKNNKSLEWKNGQSCNDQGPLSSSLDWRVGHRIERSPNNFDCRKTSRSAEQLSRSGALQTPSTKSKIVSLLKRLSPRLPRPGGNKHHQSSLPSSPGSAYPWLQIEYSTQADATQNQNQNQNQQQQHQQSIAKSQDPVDYSFQRELQLSEMRKMAMKACNGSSTATAREQQHQNQTSKANSILKQSKSPVTGMANGCTSPGQHQPSTEKISSEQPRHPNQRDVHVLTGEDHHQHHHPDQHQVPTAAPGQNQPQQQQVSKSGVASLEAPGPGAGAGNSTRRSRPHSLAVQPLNYQRLDPEIQLERAVLGSGAPRHGGPPSGCRRSARTLHQPSMTSQESIGSCSLDVDKSASDPSEVKEGSLSEKTLHSLALSCNGTEDSSSNNNNKAVLSNGHNHDSSHKQNGIVNNCNVEPSANGQNGTEDSNDDEQLTAAAQETAHKKPSYLGLACSINGYSGITRYDSKLREGFRSRDSSPGARLITRDTSPAGLRSNPESLSVTTSRVPQSISPLAMDRQHNGFANGVRDKCKVDSCLGSGRGISSTNQGYSEVDRGLSSFNDSFSPIRANSPHSRNSPVAARIASYNQQNKSYSSNISISSPRSISLNVSHSSYSEQSSMLNGSGGPDSGLWQHDSSANSEKSFIQQRVERLYGPGALAQGFFFKRSSLGGCSNNSSKLSDTSSNNNDLTLDDSNAAAAEAEAEQSLKNLPVLRHLRPEFRAQLPVVSPRRPTDGSEQIIKPLKRISITHEKNDAKETKVSPVKQGNDVINDSNMTASVTSLTDQQPAAPKVVLPVLEPSAISTNIPKQVIEAPKAVQEKDGHYFMSLLNKEREKLISLADVAETELAGSGASDLPEDAAGKLRSAAGKARLLASQKMKQFEGLCQKNINQVPGEDFPTTSEDLAGFWDMVMLQVVQVHDLFEHIERSRKSQWKDVPLEQKSSPSTPQNGSSVRRRQTPASKAKSATSSEAARKAREAREQTRRQLLEERRRAMRSNANKSSDNAVEIFVPDT